MTIAGVVLSGFGLALLAPLLTRWLGSGAGWLLAMLPAGLALYCASLLPHAVAGQPLSFSYSWVPVLGVHFSFHADGLSLLFALLISGVGALVMIYAAGYLKGHPQVGRFYAWLLMFMAAMLGVVLADNLLVLFVFWELTSLSSYALIGFEHDREEARTAALQALLVTAGGGLALLAGLVLLGLAGGTLEISTLLARGDALRESPEYLPALCLILIGAFTKSAQFPFHFWLPAAMEAPTPVSAYLHSATMVKAGVYLLARLSPALGGTAVWEYGVGGIGVATMVIGGYLALAQTDLKRLLAYSTVSALGALTFLLGLGTPLAITAAMTLLLAHALYKGALFLVAGAVDHETGTRDITQMGGLRRAMPITATAAGIAALSMAGLPPLFGFLSKELLYEAALGSGLWLAGATVLAGLLFVFVAAVVGLGPFWGGKVETPLPPHEAPLDLWVGPVVLAGLSLMVGLFPGMASHYLVAPAASAVIGQAMEVNLALWHGINPVLVLSVMTVIAGFGLYAARMRLRTSVIRLGWEWGPATVYTHALAGLNHLAGVQTGLLQSGILRTYLLTVTLTAAGLAGLTFIARGGLLGHLVYGLTGVGSVDIRFYELALAVLILLAALAAAVSQSSLSAVAALGAAGYGVGLMYLLFGAPDLAMTQFLVESLTVILFVLAFYHLPDFARLSSPSTRARDVLVAVLVGGLMTMLVLLAVAVQLHPSIAGYFGEHALGLAHGRNIVNVILVDFRALDTLGEITVLGVAAVGVYALLKLPKDTVP